MNIHLIERANNFKRLEDRKTWESGWWNLDEETVKKFIGGEVYFHRKKEEVSFYGGKIIGYRIEQDGERQGKIVINLLPCNTCRNVRTDKNGWSGDMKIVENG